MRSIGSVRSAVGLLAGVALVILVACGDDGSADMVRGEARGRASEEPAPGRSSSGTGDLRLTVSWEPDPLVAGRPVTWTLEVANRGPEPLTLRFPSGQRGDVVLRSGAQERYRWSEGMAFVQVVGEETVPAGGARAFRLSDEALDVAPGRYELTGEVSSTPAPAPVATTVVIEARA